MIVSAHAQKNVRRNTSADVLQGDAAVIDTIKKTVKRNRHIWIDDGTRVTLFEYRIQKTGAYLWTPGGERRLKATEFKALLLFVKDPQNKQNILSRRRMPSKKVYIISGKDRKTSNTVLDRFTEKCLLLEGENAAVMSPPAAPKMLAGRDSSHRPRKTRNRSATANAPALDVPFQYCSMFE